MIRSLLTITAGALLLLALGTLVLGASSYITDNSIDVAGNERVYQVTLSHGLLTVSNAPTLRMEQVLFDQCRFAYERAAERAFNCNDRLEKSKVWGTRYYKWPKQREKLAQEQIDSDAYVRALRQMYWAIIPQSSPSSFSCRGRTAIALGAVPWLTLVLPVLVLRRLRAARRSKCGLCASCGYDLRASKDRCPECGSPIERCRSVLSDAIN